MRSPMSRALVKERLDDANYALILAMQDRSGVLVGIEQKNRYFNGLGFLDLVHVELGGYASKYYKEISEDLRRLRFDRIDRRRLSIILDSLGRYEIW